MVEFRFGGRGGWNTRVHATPTRWFWFWVSHERFQIA